MECSNKGSRTAVSTLLLFLVTMQAFIVAADERTITQGTIKHNRRKRQVGDLILMGYKANNALTGSTRSADFFKQIGKKRSLSFSTRRAGRPVWLPDIDADTAGILIDPEEFKRSW
ncbi:uncharacterized protein LOC127871797 [Dreissena polymorpha]|uniref:Uncharacterized protein n=1 Tax=Dreissena polymorpha TaxID=45954 RepID=A0A9D4RQ96_DREPO|nr:uncharacterized protein LOC127871797 [Dreissena polymorpha]KAH3877456.1 hypothetical protein DPMN_001323 [Dreissena polymorpha]